MQHSPFYEIFGNFAKNTSVHYERHLRKTPVDDNITLGLPNIDIWRDIMAEMRLGAVESHFADIVWEHAPLTTRELTVLCEKELNWKRTTTYTVLKKMCNRGIFRAENSVVSVLISKEEFSSIQSEQFVEENFRGRGLGGEILRHAQNDAGRLGFDHVYLATDHIGYYEKYGFEYLSDGYHPWGESSRIYRAETLRP